MFFVVD